MLVVYGVFMVNLKKTLERVCEIYEDELRSSEEAKKYLESRGVSEESIKKFRLGFSSNNRQFLEKLFFGVGAKPLEQEGLVGVVNEIHDYETAMSSWREGDTFYYNRFPHMIMIPVFNPSGVLIGFGGRACEEVHWALRYLDTAKQTEFKGWNKQDVFYAVNFALNTIGLLEELYVFEGYFDVILAHQSGLTNSVALLGTRLIREKYDSLRRIFPKARIKLCFDGDTSGRSCAQKDALELKGDVEVYHLRGYKDPGDLFRDGKKIEEYLVRV